MTGPAASGFRCSTASRGLGEPLEGTASTVRSFLLVEAPGPWGAEALRDARLDEDVKARLRQTEARGIRPLLIRRPRASSARPDRQPVPSTGIFAAHTSGDHPWIESATLTDVRELLDLDLGPLAGGHSLRLEPHLDPVCLVCTHGRHDACCAERGRPLAAALSALAPEQTWEVSHIGGDRFAPNVLVLPHGLYYGGLSPADAAPFLETQAAGQLDLEHLRGRTAYAFPVQAAEVYVRRHLGVSDSDAVRLARHDRAGTTHRVEFVVDARRWLVVVETTRGEPRQLTCSSLRPGRALEHRLVDLRAVDPT